MVPRNLGIGEAQKARRIVVEDIAEARGKDMPYRIRFATVLVAAYATTIAPRALPREPAQSVTGSIEGRVTFQGTPPAPTSVIESGERQPVLYLGGSGGLQYVVVYLPDAPTERNPSAKAATMNQRGYIFQPQVLAVRAGQTVRFTNDDPANHNVRAQDPNPANTFSVDTAFGAAGSATHQFVATPPDRPVQLSCDIHPSMVAWVYVFNHSQFGVTDATGRFRIDNIPAGHHRLAVRQPAGRLARELSIDVSPGQAAHLDVQFTPADAGMPIR